MGGNKIMHSAKGMLTLGFVAAMDRYDMPLMYQNTEDFTKYWAEPISRPGSM